jgi:outer membrane biosynthesis protein TonB
MLSVMLRKHSTISAALMLSLSLTACGSKKSIVNSSPQSAKTDSTKSGDKKSDKTNGTLPGGLAPSKDSTPATPPLPIQAPSPTPTPAPKAKASPTPTPTASPTPAQKQSQQKQAPAAPPAPAKQQEKQQQPQQASSTNKRLTGGVGANGLVYTSTSTDSLMSFLRARNEKVPEATKQANLQAAASVLSAKISGDKEENSLSVSLQVKEGSSVVVYNMAGAFNPDASNELKAVSQAQGLRTSGSRAIRGTLKCLDADGGCETMWARVRIGDAKSGSAVVNVVFRNSSADLFFNMPDEAKESNNPEYIFLKDFIYSTIKNDNTIYKIVSSKMSSWEVVNGRSGFAVALKGGNDQLLAFAGPLLAPTSGTKVDLQASVIGKEKQKSFVPFSTANAKLDYADSIGEAKIVSNNGEGQLRMLFKMRQRASYAQDQFMITFTRKVKPLVDLSDANLN